jgi:threonine dehydrogenase-like Zn-dependent dehydrogenase
VVAKAWEQIDKVGARSWFEPRRVLVNGAGPIGLPAPRRTESSASPVFPVGRRISVNVGAANRDMVLENDAVIGSVNANLHHYRAAAAALASAETVWLAGLITRRVPLADFRDALEVRPDDIKVLLELQ